MMQHMGERARDVGGIDAVRVSTGYATVSVPSSSDRRGLAWVLRNVFSEWVSFFGNYGSISATLSLAQIKLVIIDVDLILINDNYTKLTIINYLIKFFLRWMTSIFTCWKDVVYRLLIYAPDLQSVHNWMNVFKN